MNARRIVVGLSVVVAAAAACALAGSGATPIPVPTPLPTPTILRTPLAEPSVATSPRPGASPVALPLPGALGARITLPLLGIPAATQNYAAFVRGADRQPGVIDLVRKDDELYLDLRPDNFDRPYVILPSIANGVGGPAFAGRIYDPLVVTFKRVGKRVLWITPNARYVADKGTAAAASLAVSVADSVIASTPIVAESDDKAHVVVNPTLFVSDFEGIGADLGRAAPSTPSLPGLLIVSIRPIFSVDATKSYIASTKAFAENDEISVNLTFNGPPNALPTVPDGRGIPIVVHYSIVAPPAHDPSYVPRYADDRVGYFVTERKHFGSDLTDPPIQRFIERWDLGAGPIVFTLTNEIPPQYRATVRRGILAWNEAFAKIGYPNAISVQDQPNDPHFDPDDARYNSVRWITSDAPSFVAISPHVSNPDTGQIIRATVVVDGEAVRAVRRGFVDRALPMQRAHANAFELFAGAARVAESAAPALGGDASNDAAIDADAGPVVAPDADADCDYAEGVASEAALGMTMLAANPHASAVDKEAYVQDFLFSIVVHEVGHTLGLRHNFRGSTAFTWAELHDPAFVRAHGITGSVMDYNAPNIAPPGERQTDYFPTHLGPYDAWAIRYGYAKLPAATPDGERPELRRIAAESTQPGLAYDTDEDATVPYALDPDVQRYDLSSDPLAFAAAQFAIDDDVVRNLTKTYRGDTRTYQDLRQTLITALNGDLGAAAVATRFLGGVYTSRAHRDQAGAPAPFRPVARADQRRAFALLDRYVLSSTALRESPALLNAVPVARFPDAFDVGTIRRTDFPMREVAAQVQDQVITLLFNPTVMAHIADESLRAHPGETMDLADLFGWTNAALFDDLGRPAIDPVHADLQRRFVDLEAVIALLPSQAMDALALPREVQSLARYELSRLRSKLPAAEHAASDVATRADLVALQSRIDATLHAALVQQL